MAEDLRPQIKAQVTETAKDQMARKLIVNWNYLKVAMPNIGEAPTMAQMMGNPNGKTEEERDGIAGQFIKKREAIINGKKVTLEQIDKDLDTFVAGPGQNYKAVRESFGKVSEIVPNKDAITDITEATARGIESQTGMGSKIMNFLKGALTWLASLIGSLFGGEPAMSFGDAMAQTAAPGVRDAVRGELQALAADGTRSASKVLNLKDENGKSAVDTIVDQVYNRTITELGGTPPAPTVAAAPATPAAPGAKPDAPAAPGAPVAAAPTKPEDVKPAPLDKIDRGTMVTMIYNQIMTPPAKAGEPAKTLTTQIYDQLKEGRDNAIANNPLWKGGATAAKAFAPTEAQLKTTASGMASTIANTIATRLTDPNFRTADNKKIADIKDKAEFSKVMSEEVGKEVLAAAARGEIQMNGIKLDEKFTDGPNKDKTFLDVIKAQVAEKAGEHFDSLPALLQMVKTEPGTGETRSGTPLVSRMNIPGVSGGQDTGETRLGAIAPKGSGPDTRTMAIT